MRKDKMKGKSAVLAMAASIMIFSILLVPLTVMAQHDLSIDALEPQVEFEMFVLVKGQSTTVTADHMLPVDFKVTPVMLLGPGILSISMSKRDSDGEVVGIMEYSTGFPSFQANTGITPVTVELERVEFEGNGLLLLISGGIFLSEDDVHRYTILLSYNELPIP